MGTRTESGRRLPRRSAGVWLALASAVVLVGSGSSAQDVEDYPCAGDNAGAGGGASTGVAWGVAPSDTRRGLVVFVKFSDEDVAAADGDPTRWLHSATTVPAWANDLLEDYDNGNSPLPPGWAPQDEGSLTHFFYQMSRGRHVLLGETYPLVVEADQTIAHYHGTYGAYYDASGHANEDVLNQLTAAGVDWRKYNYDKYGSADDRVVDFVFVYHREFRDATGDHFMNQWIQNSGGVLDTTYVSGHSDLLTQDIVVSYPDGDMTIAEGGGTTNYVKVEQCTPAKRIRNRWQFLAIAAHEYGHDLGVPAGFGGAHLSSIGPYDIMDGTYHGHWLMSAWMRFKLGWIDPPVYDYTSGNVTITLGDAAIDGSAGCAILKTHVGVPGETASQYFLLEGRNSSSTGYTKRQPVDATSECCKTRPQYSGLLITHVREGGATGDNMWRPGHPAGERIVPRIDPEVATGMLDSLTAAPDPIRGKDLLAVREGSTNTHNPQDLFVPAFVTDDPPGLLPFCNAFTPYTNPSTDLYRDDLTDDARRQDVYSGISVHNIRNAGPSQDPWAQIQCEVSWDYEGSVPRARGAADTLRVDTIWQGQVQLTGDLVVKEGTTLTINQGARVVAAATDRLQGGKDPARPELLVRGTATAVGSVHGIEMVSSRNNVWTHFSLPGHFDATGELTSAAAGDWYGPRFELTGCSRPSYGYAVCAQPLSALEKVTIEDAQVGVGIENLCAPRLKDVEFADIVGQRHIYLDGSDVCLPAGYWATGDCASPGTFQPSAGTWDLRPGTHVVAKNGAPAVEKDAWVGNLGKVDLIAFAPLTAEGTVADSIHFRPETPDVANGDGWGTLFLGSESVGSSLTFVDIGYSAQPLFAYYPSSVTIRRSRIHHFSDTGLFIYRTGQFGAVVDSCVIERGAGLSPSLGARGAVLSNTSELRFQESRVDLSGLALSEGSSAAVDVFYTKVFCQTAAPAESLVVRRTELVGPGSGTTADHQGIRSLWVCGSALRKILYDENYIHGFRKAGLEFNQCSDIQVNCNTVFDNRRAVDLYRDSEPTGPGVRFRRNWLEVNVGVEQMVRTDHNQKTKLGLLSGFPMDGTAAENGFAVRNQDVDWVETLDPSSTYLPAEANFWFLSSGSGWAQQVNRDAQTHEPWASRIVPYNIANPIVDYDPWGGLVYNPPYCHAPPSGMVASPGETQLGEEARRPSGMEPVVEEAATLLPRVNDFRVISSIGGRGSAILELAVAPGKEGRYVVEVFDVSGRRVATLLEGPSGAGVHRLAWSGRDAGVSTAASGVYFARVAGPSWTVIRKVVLVR